MFYLISTCQLLCCCVVFDLLVVLKVLFSEDHESFVFRDKNVLSSKTNCIKYRCTHLQFSLSYSTKISSFFRYTILIDYALLLSLISLSWGLVLYLLGFPTWCSVSCLGPLLLPLFLILADTWYILQVAHLGQFLFLGLKIDNFW